MFYFPFVSSLLKYLGVALIVSRNFQLLTLSDGPDSLLLLTYNAYLQCDYYNWGHLDKVYQSDYRKITIHSEKVSCQS